MQGGSVGSVPTPVSLPAEALPAEGGEVERHLASVTISDKVMDADMRAIMNDEVSQRCADHT